ncbi:tetratricopeptide repeat protein [Streptomyces sp. NPDC050211]|uniref:tetratricopeptide repeat protein n=1 Tax=Streptomyces sp. NPDC050211 TaxID=3154932 RepID=UPI00343FF51C
MTKIVDEAVALAEQHVLAEASDDTPLPSLSGTHLTLVARTAADDPGTVVRLCYLAALLTRLNRRDDALSVLRITAASYEDSPDLAPHIKATALNRLAVAVTSLGDWTWARNLLTRAAAECRASEPLLCARTYANLAAVEVRAARLTPAWEAAGLARSFLAGQHTDSARDIVTLLSWVDLALARAGGGVASAPAAMATVRTVELADDDSASSIAALTARAVLAFEEARESADGARLREVTDALHVIAYRAAAVLGGRHPQTVIARIDLACAEFEWARHTGDLRRMAICAERLETVATRAALALGAGHPLAVSALTNHANALLETARARRSARQLTEAVRHLDQAAGRSRAALGPDHPVAVLAAGTARAGRHLRAAGTTGTEPDGGGGTTLTLVRPTVTDPWRPGEPLLSPQAAALDLAPDDAVAVLRERNRIASGIGDAGNASAARHLFESLEQECRQRLGAVHPVTLAARHNAAYWTGVCGRAPHARQLSLQLMPTYRDLLPGVDTKSATRRLRDDLARWTGESGHPGEAVRQYADLRADHEREFGPDHWETLLARHNAAYWTGVEGARHRALEQFRALLADQLRVHGPDHVHTLAARHNIAHWTEATGHPGEALRLFTELLHDRTAALGPDHPHTLLNRYHVARLERPSVGGEELTRLLPVFLRVFGEEHPWTRRLRHEIDAP